MDNEEAIICPECGTKNPPAKMLCGNCGFNLELLRSAKEIEEAKKIESSLSTHKENLLTSELNDWERTRLLRILIGINIYVAIVLSIFALFAIAYFSRFLSNWPYENTFYADSDRMADTLLKVKSLIDTDATKGEFALAIRELLAESARYTTKYEHTAFKSNEIFTQLKSSAQFYVMGNEAWDNELRATYGRSVSTIPASTASDNVRKLWNSASASLERAIANM